MTVLAEHLTAGFSGYAMPVALDAEALADRVRVEDIDLHASFELWSAGAVVATVLVARRGSRARVASMCVPPGLHGHGWGRVAMDQAVAEAQSRGEELRLEVLTDNDAAVRLYERCGFERTRQLVGFEAGAVELAGRATSDDVVALQPVPTGRVADAVAAAGADLSWQLSAPSLAGLSGQWRGWALGPALAVARPRGETLQLLGLVTEPGARRRGHARRLLAALAGRVVGDAPSVSRVGVISIVPAGLLDDFAARAGLHPAPVRQWEMVRALTPGSGTGSRLG
ncbi:hypothetical protein ADJ73_03400 [Arsenicicoccus sp. oral taxon 190]|nr:hypothetical protein ADJ73_03400 [Arsenicicoccus sp. oral taxon 190]